MSRIIDYTTAVTVNPSSYDSQNSNWPNYSYGVNSGLTGTNNTTAYATFRLQSTNYYAYYSFDTSSIPSNATINSVSCSVRGRSYSTTYYGKLQLCNGTTTKGSVTNFTQTASTVVSLTPGTWNREEVSNIKLKITPSSSSSNNRYFRFYGADLTINYTVSGVEYEVTATSEYDGASVSPSSQFILQGEDAVVRIDTDTLDNMVLEDNGTDVTENLQYVIPQGDDTISRTPTTFSTGGSQTNTTFYRGSSQYTGTTWLEQAIGHSAENPSTENTTGNTYVKSSQSSNYTSGWMIYNFDFSEIPEDAIIDSTEVRFYGAKEEAGTDVQHRCRVELYSGNSSKANYYELTNTSNALITLPAENTGTWTRAELQQAKFRFSIAYYGGRLMGITWEVNYHTPTSPYYQYTLSNIAADHDIVFKESVIVPPEEDPQKTYYSLTISSINATTEPGRGTTRVESGSSETITIYPTDPLVTLIRDNGVDVSSQMVQHAGSQPTYEVTTQVAGASYGFPLNTSTGYYTSNNNGVASSAALCRVNFNLPVRCLVTIKYINYGEATYDFGVFSKVDTALSLNAWTSSSNAGDTTTDAGLEQIRLNTSEANTQTEQTLTYEIPAGEHFIDVKYGKDQASDTSPDNLRFKIDSITELEATNYYTYTLSNINQDHSLIFIFGDVTYYFVDSSCDGDSRLYPDGQMVCLPGDTYKLTIVPKDAEAVVTATDNNTDVTSSLQRKEVVTEKNGQSALTVNYVYTLSNVQTGHTILVHDSSTVRYNVNASSTYAGATVSPASQRIEEGDDAVISINATNLYEIKVKDNGVDVTSNVGGESGRYRYTIEDVQSAHTIVVEEAPYYTITTANTYAGASISCASKVYAGQSVTATITVANLYEIVFKDNNVEKTPTGSNGTFTYTLNNVSADHTLSITEATSYTISTSSSYAGVTATANPSKVYVGQNCTITITGASKDTMIVKDNNVDVTNSLVGSNNSYTYTISNVSTSHTITVAPITYAVNASSTFAGVTITPSSSSVIKGNSVTLTINSPNTYSIKIMDNGVDKTSSITGSANNYKYTISNVTAAHTVVVSEDSYYTITANSTYTGATVSATPTKVYVRQTANVTVTISGDIVPIKVTDNNVDVTDSLTVSGNNKLYQLTNVNTAHTITVSFVQTAFVKTSSGYVAGKKYFRKTGASTWTEMTLSEFQTYINSNDIFYD